LNYVYGLLEYFMRNKSPHPTKGRKKKKKKKTTKPKK